MTVFDPRYVITDKLLENLALDLAWLCDLIDK